MLTADVGQPLAGQKEDSSCRLTLVDPVWNEHPWGSNLQEVARKSMASSSAFSRIGSIAKEAMEIFLPRGIDMYIYDSCGGRRQGACRRQLSPLHGKTRTWSHRRKNPVRLGQRRASRRVLTLPTAAGPSIVSRWTSILLGRQPGGRPGRCWPGCWYRLARGIPHVVDGPYGPRRATGGRANGGTARKRAAIPPPGRQCQRRLLPPRQARTDSGRQQAGVRQLGIHARGVAVDDHRRHRRGLRSRRIWRDTRSRRPRNIP